MHLAQANLIARFGWGGALQEPAASFYQWNPWIEPNASIYLLLAGLIRLTGDALIANSLFLSLYGLLWIGAAYAVSRSETERPILPMLLLLPIAFGVFIHWGFYNFALGVPLFLLFAAFWRSVRERGDATAFVTTALFFGALYLTHITAVAAACLLLAADGVARSIRELERSGLRAAGRRLTIDGAWAAAAALPVLLLIASFMMAYQNIPGEPLSNDGGITQIFRRIFAATYLFSFTWWELVALAPLLGALAVAAIAALRRITSGDLMWPVFFVLVLLVSLLNLKIGPAPLSERLAPFSGIAIVMTIASRQPGAALVRTLLRGSACRPDRPERGPFAGLQELGPDAGKRTRCRARQPRKDVCQPRPDRAARQQAVRLARSPDAACRANRGAGRPRRRTVVAAAVDPLFRLLPAAICRSAGFHALDHGLGRRSRSRRVGKIPHRQPGRAASPDRVVFQRGRIGVANKLGYRDCTENRAGQREISVCRVPTEGAPRRMKPALNHPTLELSIRRQRVPARQLIGKLR